MTVRNLILSGGIAHPFDETSALIARQLEPLGIQSNIHPVREGLARLGETAFDMLTINALAFTMSHDKKYAPQRADHAFTISETEKVTIRAHLQAGGKLLGLHTAAICFDDWPEWREYLGIAWDWGTSHHPQPGPVRVNADPPFDTVDELYCSMSLHPDAEVLVTATCDGVAEAQPILLRHGNAAYLALGHDATAVQTPGHFKLLTQAAGALLTSQKGAFHAVH